MESLPDGPGLWARRHFVLLVGSRVADNLGTVIAPAALAFAMLDLTGSVGDLGVVVAARSAGLALFLVIGGMLADRHSRSMVLGWSNVATGALQFVVVLMLLSGSDNVAAIAGVSALAGATDGISYPAGQGMVPRVVPGDQLQRANSVYRGAVGSVRLAGLAFGGALIVLIGPVLVLVVDVLTSLVAAVLALMIRLEPADAAEGETLREQFIEGWQAFVRWPWVWLTSIGFALVLMMFHTGIAVLGPVRADETFGRSWWAWLLAAEVAGGLLASFVLTRRRSVMRLASAVAIGGGPGLFIVALGLTGRPWLLVPVAVVSGAAAMWFVITWSVHVQQLVPDEELSRVYGWDGLLSVALVPLGQVMAGPVVLVVGVTTALVIAGSTILATCLALALTPAVRSLRPAPVVASTPAAG